jgi:hypothetical protein
MDAHGMRMRHARRRARRIGDSDNIGAIDNSDVPWFSGVIARASHRRDGDVHRDFPLQRSHSS